MKIIATTRKVRVEDKEDFTSGGFQDLTIEVELSKDYENLYNYVTFGNVAVPIIEGKVKTPTLTAGICKIGVYGYDGKEKLKLRYSPMPVDVLVKKGSFTDRTAQQSIPTPTEFEKCVDELRDLLKEAKIIDGSVTTEKLADEAVTTDKIATSAVTGSKVAERTITRSKIADNAINSAKIEDSAITSEKIEKGAITTSKFAPGAVDDVALHPEIIEFLESRAGREEIPTRISQLMNDTHCREYVEILDSKTAEQYISESGTKHKELRGSDFYLGYIPNEINIQHTTQYSKISKTAKSDNPSEYIYMYIAGVAAVISAATGNFAILLDDNGEADITFYSEDYNYGGTDSYRILLGKPYVSEGFTVESDWDSTKGTEVKGDSLLGDKSSAGKNYSCHIKQLGDATQCTISCTVTFQKYERSGLAMKWVTKDAGIMNIPFNVTRPRADTRFKGLYFITANQILLLSANTDLAERMQLIENTLSQCVKKNESPKLIGEIAFDGSQTEKQYEFPFPQDFSKIFVNCTDITSDASNYGNIFFAIRGNPGLEMAGNQFVGRFGTKVNGIFRIERFGDFVIPQSVNILFDTAVYGRVIQIDNPYDIAIAFDEVVPKNGKVQIYYV